MTDDRMSTLLVLVTLGVLPPPPYSIKGFCECAMHDSGRGCVGGAVARHHARGRGHRRNRGTRSSGHRDDGSGDGDGGGSDPPPAPAPAPAPAPYQPTIMADPLASLIARAEARAHLYSVGEHSLHEAVDLLQHDAGRAGLIERYGQDFVQTILADAFAAVRPELNHSNHPAFSDPQPPSGGSSTFDAALYLTRTNNPEKFEVWLREQSPDRAAPKRRGPR